MFSSARFWRVFSRPVSAGATVSRHPPPGTSRGGVHRRSQQIMAGGGHLQPPRSGACSSRDCLGLTQPPRAGAYSDRGGLGIFFANRCWSMLEPWWPEGVPIDPVQEHHTSRAKRVWRYLQNHGAGACFARAGVVVMLKTPAHLSCRSGSLSLGACY